MNRKNLILTVSVTALTSLLLGVLCGWLITAFSERPPYSMGIYKAYEVADKAAENECLSHKGTPSECASLVTASIQDVSCWDLAPQNGGKDRCGYWIVSFTGNTTYMPFKIIDVEVRYDSTVIKTDFKTAHVIN